MLVHRRVTPSIKLACTHLYTWVERGTVRLMCLAQENNTMSPARARTRTVRSGDERTNHEASAPPCVPFKEKVFHSEYFTRFVFLFAVNATAWFNNQAFHSIAVSLAAADNAILRFILGTNFSLTTINHPLPRTAQESINDLNR